MKPQRFLSLVRAHVPKTVDPRAQHKNRDRDKKYEAQGIKLK